jgi:hypothetical protein
VASPRGSAPRLAALVAVTALLIAGIDLTCARSPSCRSLGGTALGALNLRWNDADINAVATLMANRIAPLMATVYRSALLQNLVQIVIVIH